MSDLPIDWRFRKDHAGLEESGAIGTGFETLIDFGCTVILTETNGLPEDGSFGAGLGDRIRGGITDGAALGSAIRGMMLEDDRIEELDLTVETTAGLLKLPFGIIASDGPYRIAGPLTSQMIEDIIADMGLENP